MAGSYIPAADAPFDSWLVNFDTLLTADPTAYGETAGTAAAVAVEVAAWSAAYLAATDPSTRTTATIAAKDAARVTSTAVVRPVAQRINANAAVTNQQRADLGITIRKTDRTPVPPPSTQPILALVGALTGQHKIKYSDTATPDTKAKPFGVIGMELFRAVGAIPAVDPATATYVGTVTKSPFFTINASGEAGQVATYFARWITTSGPSGIAQQGPWSAGMSAVML